MENLIMKIEKIFEERVEENRKLFTEKDMLTINNNKDIMKKIYLLGLINGRDIYNIKWHTEDQMTFDITPYKLVLKHHRL